MVCAKSWLVIPTIFVGVVVTIAIFTATVGDDYRHPNIPMMRMKFAVPPQFMKAMEDWVVIVRDGFAKHIQKKDKTIFNTNGS